MTHLVGVLLPMVGMWASWTLFWWAILHPTSRLERLEAQQMAAHQRWRGRIVAERQWLVRQDQADTRLARLRLALYRAGVRWTAPVFVVMVAASMVGAILVGRMLFGNWLAAIILGASGWIIPGMVLDALAARRRALYVAQLEVFLENLANMLRIGVHLLQAMPLAMQETEAPLRPDLEEALESVAKGTPLGDALAVLAWRNDVEALEEWANAVSIYDEYGGDLHKLTLRIADDIQQSRAIAQRTKADLVSASMLNWAAMIMMLIIFEFVAHMTPSLGQLLYTTGAGTFAIVFVALATVVELAVSRYIGRMRQQV